MPACGGAPQLSRRPLSSPAGRSPAPWTPPCRQKSLPVGGGMCVSFSVLNLFFFYSYAEQSTPPQSLGIGSLPLLYSFPRPRFTNSRTRKCATIQPIGLRPLPLQVSYTGAQRAPLPPPLGPGTTPAFASRLALLMGAARLPTGLKQRR